MMMNDMNASDDDGAAEVDPNKCYKCGGKYAARYAGNWIGCHRAGCGRWLHKKCVSEIDLINISEEDFENFYFECIYC